MLELTPHLAASPLRVLCLGAHCDDIEIGCGGALLELQQAGAVETIDWVVLSGTESRRAEAQRAMSLMVKAKYRGDLVFGDFRDGAMPSQYAEIKAFVESLRGRPSPDLIFTHEREDRHQDHRVVNEMTWNTFRDHLVLEYEVAKWDGGLTQPNVYFPLAAERVDKKIQVLLESYRSQFTKDWFGKETFEGLLRIRGIECRSGSGFAEAFHGRKVSVTAGHCK